MELTKYKKGEVLAHIRHDLRQLPPGKSYGNESVDPALSHLNYSLIDRGKTVVEVNQYRKNFEKQVFKYNRSNLVHAVELVIQCPADCPPDQHEAFFQTAFNWYCENYLPAGIECVFTAQVHRDEHKYRTTIKNGKEVTEDISKDHLHIAYVPAIPAGKKHTDYKFRLSADALTKKAILRDMHPSLQKALDKAGIQATVYTKKNSNGKSRTIPLSVQELKAITDQTGVVIDHSLTIEELGKILSKNVELSKTVTHLQEHSKSQTATIDTLQKKLQKLYSKAQTLKTDAERIISEKNLQISTTIDKNKQLQAELHSTQEILKSREQELQQEHEQKIAMENALASAEIKEPEWGSNATWGASSGWDHNGTKEHIIEEEIDL